MGSKRSATFVIIGGGIAGVSCLEGLSFLMPSETIILISSSPLVKTVTNIMPITKTLSHFDVEEKSLDDFSNLHPGISIIHATVIGLDSQHHSVILTNGEIIQYKKLCICAGGNPKIIAENNSHVLGIRDTESVKEFELKIKNASKIVVVGNGGIATEIVHEIEGIEMVWVIKDKHISATFVDPGAAEFFQNQVRKIEDKKERERSMVKRLKYTTTSEGASSSVKGAALGPDWHRSFELSHERNESSKVIIEYQCEVQCLKSRGDFTVPPDDEWPIYVELTNGKIIGCDFVVSATGVIPNSQLFVSGNDNLEIAEDGGLKVDWKMETTVPDVFAAGDICTASWDKAHHWFQMRLWTQARHMGMYAAKSMVGSLRGEEILQDFCFELFSHVTYFFGFKVVLLGLFNGQKLNGEYEVLLRVTKGAEYIKLVMKDGKMQGAVLIGETDLEEMCENLILNQLDLTEYGEDLLNPDIDIEDYFD
ncbi:hypothetical protein R5R35_007017 [Gryllus longicercus]|uniref:Pyridine nucleotide-disulfide oxidoreductase domain-containing protein 1 n=1 Tax=Gryllus longicercus TaxID=2509291 RepID=A0AAN9VVU0_9ORTH